eukprot:TRINITY_DN31678_c0_g1_i1.p1 TRINITY_DN31678_c0_g1~~TRINITY_DN31678_c0_g1_i1.p1  ORF type:complete len:638 (+),score=102.48 TRINITY_DN31678_c0_g1_i1:84-1997(+)
MQTMCVRLGLQNKIDPVRVSVHGEPPRFSIGQTLRAFFKLFYPYFLDQKTRIKAWLLVTIIAVFLYLEVQTGVEMAHIMKQVHNAMVHGHEGKFTKRLEKAGLTMLSLAPITLLHTGAAWLLKLSWRRYLTERLLDMYIDNTQCFYRLKMQYGDIDNPDQRIAQDVAKFTHVSFSLMVHLARDVLQIVMNSFALYAISEHLFWLLLGVSSVYVMVTVVCFASPLMRVERHLLTAEADFRYILIRLREHAESIAFFRGAGFEFQACQTVLDRAISTSYRKGAIDTIFHSIIHLVNHVTKILPMLVVAPMYFSGAVDFGTVGESQTLFHHMMHGMIDLGKEMNDIASLGAQSVRILELWEALQEIRSGGQRQVSNTAKDFSDEECGDSSNVQLDLHIEDLSEDDSTVRLKVEQVTLYTPVGDAALLRAVSLNLMDGDSLLIEGPSGSGKSSLLRAIAGLWARGTGVISRTAFEKSFFVPQTPYLCIGSLRENVLYPVDSTCHEVSDQDIELVLNTLHIGYLVERHGLRCPVEFDGILSGGEKQRLSFARLLLRKDLELTLLDEATSALDEANERLAYELLRQQVPSYVSVGHRAQLAEFHTMKLLFTRLPDGACEGTSILLEQASETRTPSLNNRPHSQ